MHREQGMQTLQFVATTESVCDGDSTPRAWSHKNTLASHEAQEPVLPCQTHRSQTLHTSSTTAANQEAVQKPQERGGWSWKAAPAARMQTVRPYCTAKDAAEPMCL